MTASYFNSQNEKFSIIEDYTYHGFDIQIDRKESTGEFYGKLYNSYKPYNLIESIKDIDLDNVKSILEEAVYQLIDDE